MKHIWNSEEGISYLMGKLFYSHSLAGERAIRAVIFLIFKMTLASLFKMAETDLILHLPVPDQRRHNLRSRAFEMQ